ncbi:MAG: hypothetical protein ACI4VR_04010 [Bacilli bacterium]
MKESRIIIIISIVMLIALIPLLYVLQLCGISSELSINIITNLGCGIIVGLVTAICQYCMAKRRIISTVYSFYFELYMTYYYVKNKEFLQHYNSLALLKKLTELSTKIKDTLSEYHGFFKKQDSMYVKINPQINMGENYKAEKLIKTIVKWFNKKSFDESVEPFISEVENILKNIDEKRFKEDKEQMIKMFNYIWK